MSLWIKKASKKAGLAPGTILYTGRKKQSHVDVSVIEYNSDVLSELVVSEISTLPKCAHSNQVSWINVNGIHDIELVRSIGKHLKLHELLLEDVANIQQRPKTEEFDEYIYVTLKMIQWDEEKETIKREHVSLIVGNNYVLSFQEESGDVFEWVRQRLRRGKGRIRTLKSDYLAYALIDAIVDGYFVAVEKMGDKIESLEEKIMDDPSKNTLAELNLMKREMIALRKATYPLRDAINWFIKSEHSLISAEVQPYLKDLYDHTIQINEVIESYREMLGGLFDIYLSTTSNKMNEVMKVLTVFAAIFIPLTFLAGIYGMNFEHIPELHYKYGYYVLWSVMIVMGLGMLAWFKKKKWL